MNTKPKTVQEYIESMPEIAQTKLREMRTIIASVVPEATESLKWGMPAFSYQRMLVAYAAFKHHIGLYPTPKSIEVFNKELKEYVTSKGAIQFPIDKKLPSGLIKKIVKYRAKQSLEEDAKWKTS